MKYALVFLIVLIAIGVYIYVYKKGGSLGEADAISVLKSVYPQYQSYPNDNLPPQSIRTEADSTGWYVAFVQEGSGRPVVGAHCYFVGNDKKVTDIGEFKPTSTESEFSLRTCKILN